MTVYDPPSNAQRGISVRELLDDPALELNVRLVAGAPGLDRSIGHPRIQKSGLAMVGHVHGISPRRIQILGETEMSYARGLDAEDNANVGAVDGFERNSAPAQEQRRGLPRCGFHGGVRDGDAVPDARALEALALHEQALHGLLFGTYDRREHLGEQADGIVFIVNCPARCIHEDAIGREDVA